MQGIKLVSAVLLLGACGSSSVSPVDACNQEYETECSRVYECYTAAQLAAAGFPASESACVTTSQANQGCSAKTEANFCTGGNTVYHGEAVDGCIQQLEGLTCAEIMSNQDITITAPKCAEVCVTPT
ncbi:MAG: hypothetical protein ABI467_31555 [Kofleriaceae bacterium]